MLALAAVAAPAFAQPAPPITWVAYTQGKPGKTSDWVKLTVKYDAPIYEKLMAAGVVRSWGIATPINHRPGFGWNLLTWVTVDNWAGVEKWAGAAMQTMQARSDAGDEGDRGELRGRRAGRAATSTRSCATPSSCRASRAAKIGYFLVGPLPGRAGPGRGGHSVVQGGDRADRGQARRRRRRRRLRAARAGRCTASSSPIGNGRTAAGTRSPTWARSTASRQRSPPVITPQHVARAGRGLRHGRLTPTTS